MYATMEQTTILVFNSKEKNKKKIKRKSEKRRKKETTYVQLRSFSHREKKKRRRRANQQKSSFNSFKVAAIEIRGPYQKKMQAKTEKKKKEVWQLRAKKRRSHQMRCFPIANANTTVIIDVASASANCAMCPAWSVRED